MRTYPFPNPSEDDVKELVKLNADAWQVEQLKYNPSYTSWGNHEDYMSDKNNGWRSAVTLSRWSERFDLDSYNELVNFYFFLERKAHNCPHCEGSYLNPATKKLNEDWYSFYDTEYINDRPGHRYNNKAWQYHLTEVEIEALVKDGRLNDLVGLNCWFEEETNIWMAWVSGVKMEIEPPVMPTPEAVNLWATQGMGHDAINRFIAVEARAKHLGVYGHCEHCVDGVIYDESKAKLGLQMWFLHPRKGASRGVLIEEIHENELPEIYAYLREAAKRNEKRFNLIPTE